MLCSVVVRQLADPEDFLSFENQTGERNVLTVAKIDAQALQNLTR
jgi:hypothetical protein